MDIRHLNAFIAVFEERNITLAAQRLYTSQPSLSVTIRQLEEELATPLFIRQPRGVEVSPDARILYPQARRLVAEAQALSRQFRQFRQRDDRWPLSLGVDDDVANSHIQAFLRLAYSAVPKLQLDLQPSCGGAARLAVEEQRCEDELFLPLWDDPFVLCLPNGHSLADKAQVDAQDLAELQWITCPQHASHQRLMALYKHCAGDSAGQAGSLLLACQLVAAGAGVALLPSSLSESAGLLQRPVNLPLPNRRIGLCYAAQALENPALNQLHAQLQPTAAR